MPFHILAVRAPEDEPSVLYPELDAQLMPKMAPADGRRVTMQLARGLTVSRIEAPASAGQKTTFHRLSGATGVTAEMWLTDQRLVVRCKNYASAKWSAGDSFNAMLFGGNLALADFEATKLFHRMKNRGKAMTGHVYFPWIHSIAYHPRVRGVQNAGLLLVVARKVNQEQQQLQLLIDLDNAADAKNLADDILHRCCAWWLAGPGALAAGPLRDKFAALAKHHLTIPPPGSWTQLTLPAYRLCHAPGITPAHYAYLRGQAHHNA